MNDPINSFEGWMRSVELKLGALERAVGISSADEILGPGFGPTATAIPSWNDEQALLNGYYFTDYGSAAEPNGGPDPQKQWVGTVAASPSGEVVVQTAVDPTDPSTSYNRVISYGGTGRSDTGWIKAGGSSGGGGVVTGFTGDPTTGVSITSTASGSGGSQAVEFEDIAIGSAASTTGAGGSIAIGAAAYAGVPNASGGTSKAVAIGLDARAVGQDSVCIGSGSGGQGATADEAVAIGQYAYASAVDATAVGFNAQAGGQDSTAVGSNSQAQGQNSFAGGYASNALGQNSVAIGGAQVDQFAQNSIAIGSGAHVESASGLAIGLNAVAVGGVAIGAGAQSNASASFVLGTSSNNVYVPGYLILYDHSTSGSQKWYSLRVVNGALSVTAWGNTP